MNELAPAAPADAGQADGQGTPAPEAPANDGDVKAWFDVEGVTDEQKGYIETKGWSDDPLKALTSYQELEKFQGVPADQLIKLPQDLTADGAMDDVYNRLGRPETAEGYEAFTPPEGAQAIDEGRMAWADKMAHGIGLNQAQRDALATATMEYEGAAMAEMQKAVELEQTAQLETLKTEWGAEFGEREELARRAVNSFLPDGVDKGALLNAIEGAVGSAVMLKMFANAGQQIGEDKIHDSADGVKTFGFSPEQAKAEKAQIFTKLKDETNKDQLKSYNAGKGTDYERVQVLDQIIHGVA